MILLDFHWRFRLDWFRKTITHQTHPAIRERGKGGEPFRLSVLMVSLGFVSIVFGADRTSRDVLWHSTLQYLIDGDDAFIDVLTDGLRQRRCREKKEARKATGWVRKQPQRTQADVTRLEQKVSDLQAQLRRTTHVLTDVLARHGEGFDTVPAQFRCHQSKVWLCAVTNTNSSNPLAVYCEAGEPFSYKAEPLMDFLSTYKPVKAAHIPQPATTPIPAAELTEPGYYWWRLRKHDDWMMLHVENPAAFNYGATHAEFIRAEPGALRTD